MQRTYSLKKIIVFGVLVIALVGVIAYLFLKPKTPSDLGPTNQDNLFPFGNQTPVDQTGGIGIEPTADAPITSPLERASAERLRQITNYPVSGFGSTVIQKTISEPKLDESTGELTLVSSQVPATLLRWNGKRNGLIVEAEITRDSIIVTQKSTNEIPLVQESIVANQAQTFIFRLFNEESRVINSLSGTLPSQKTLTYCTTTFTTDLSNGSRGEMVKALQAYLGNKLTKTITVDGSYGKGTASLVTNVQKVLGVPETGIIDEATRTAINADCTLVQKTFAEEKNKPQLLTLSFLEDNILRAVMSPDTLQLFSIKKDGPGIAGIITDASGRTPRRIFTSPFTEWNPQWISKTTIALSTLPSQKISGYLYFLDIASGELKKILGPIAGLTTNVNPTGTTAIISQSTDRGITTFIAQLNKGQQTALGLQTFPEKCVWKNDIEVLCAVPQQIPSAEYPDAWYQGTQVFSDVLWSINTETNATELLLTPQIDFDMILPSISSNGEYFFFINKRDGTLWSYRLI